MGVSSGLAILAPKNRATAKPSPPAARKVLEWRVGNLGGGCMAYVSRRNLFATGAAALAFAPGLARAAAVADLPPTKATPADIVQGASDFQDRLTVETYVNGKGPFQFVIDTGADRSILSEDLGFALGLPPAEDVIVQGIARALPAHAVHLENLHFGRASLDNIVMPLLPRVWLGADGYLGLDVLDDKLVTFDFQNNRMEVAVSDMRSHALYMDNDVLVRVSGDRGRLTAFDCQVNGTRAYAFVDSGAQYSIGNGPLFAELKKNGATFINPVPVPLIGVTGGAAYGSVTALQSIKLGPVRFSRGGLVISDLPVFDIWGLGDKPAMFLGMNLLKTLSSFSIDYGRKELRFRTAQIRLASRA
jgi:predicted aspartyl protease